MTCLYIHIVACDKPFSYNSFSLLFYCYYLYFLAEEFSLREYFSHSHLQVPPTHPWNI